MILTKLTQENENSPACEAPVAKNYSAQKNLSRTQYPAVYLSFQVILDP